ncbi:MAG: GFA family protein [Hyphomonadaceae bacterium]
MHQGGCHCGAIRYEALAPPARNSICHCKDCRRSAGAPVMAWALYAAKDIRVTKGTPKIRASSEHGRRHFCADCGTGLFYTNDQIFVDQIDVQSATLDDPDVIPPPAAQVQVVERIGWMADAHRAPEFARYPGMD